jgi:5'-3' exonuclease
VDLHLVDATYELFRAHFAPRPAVRGRDGIVLSGVTGLVEQLLFLLREQEATHVGCATDRVIRSFRNDLYAGYKTDDGVPAELLAQFPIAEAAIEALGLALWPMVELEADDAIATAAARWADHPAVGRVVICSPDKDLAQCVRDDRVVLWDRRRDLTYDAAGVRAKWGVEPSAVADRLALVGDAADGYPGIPGWGGKSAAAVLARYGTIDAIPERTRDWDVPSLRGVAGLAASLAQHHDEVILYRTLARLRTDAPLPQQDPDVLRWRGALRDSWLAFCDRWGLARLRAPASLDRRGATVQMDSATGRVRRSLVRSRADERQQRRVVCRRRRHEPERLRPAGEVEPGAALEVGDGRSRTLGDEPGAGHVPGRQPALLDEGVEAAVGDVGEGERRRAHRARDADRATDRPRTHGDRPTAQGHRDDEVREALLVADRAGQSPAAVRRRSRHTSRPASGRGRRPRSGARPPPVRWPRRRTGCRWRS